MIVRLANHGLRRIGLMLVPAPPPADLLVDHVTTLAGFFHADPPHRDVDVWLLGVIDLLEPRVRPPRRGGVRAGLGASLRSVAGVLELWHAERRLRDMTEDGAAGRLYAAFEARLREQR